MRNNMKIDTRLFSFAGSSADPTGVYKARFANDLNARPKVLQKEGHTNFVLVALPKPMTKLDAIVYLQKTKPAGVNQEALAAKAVYIKAQEAKIAGVVNGTGKRRGRPAKVKVATPVAKAPVAKAPVAKAPVAKAPVAKTTAPVKSTPVPAPESIVNTIVNTARRGTSIRAKAQLHASKVSARQVAANTTTV